MTEHVGCLRLVLDLDHTLVAASRVPPRVGEEHSDVHALDLPSHGRCWVRLRPHARYFCLVLRRFYTLAVHTHGSAEYARAVVGLLDPGGQLFEGRVVARDGANPAVGAASKSLAQQLPAGFTAGGLDALRRHALVVDDRIDVWAEADQANVLQIARFLHFEDGHDAKGPPLPLPPATPGRGAGDDHLLCVLRVLTLARRLALMRPRLSRTTAAAAAHWRRRQRASAAPAPAPPLDLRVALGEARRRVLAGCTPAWP